MQAQIDRMYTHYNSALQAAKLEGSVSKEFRTSADLAEQLGSLAPTRHNSIEILNGYDDIIKEITASIYEAKEYVYVEFFALVLDTTTEPFFTALEQAVKRGIEVHVLFDTLGSRKYPGYRSMQKRLTNIGVRWHKMLPIRFNLRHYNRPDLRNHRKIVVVDNQHAFLGSLNMVDKHYHRRDKIHYVELVSHLQGPAVNEAAAVFASDWYSETEEILHHFLENTDTHKKGRQVVQILPSGPGYQYRNNLKVFVDLVHKAQSSVIITNPYLVPDESLLAALLTAQLRGVHVSILNSEAMDQWMVGHAQRSYYQELLDAGIVIHLYKAPLLVHSKYMAIDGEVAIIGSSNLDIRSFELNLECSVIAYDKETARVLHEQHMHDLKHAYRLTSAQWRRRSTYSQFLDSIARLTSSVQ
jgi:cardiolipin synthase